MALADLGVCYFPEHWSPDEWPQQAQDIAALGIRLVRMGEFAWSRIEPARGEFCWQWLDQAIEILAGHSLSIILCTPTACPPKWLVDECPDILPVGSTGAVRGFGSRRHYRFASERYREESLRITGALLQRYGAHPAIVGWQLDNEYGCHDTTLSYAASDRASFRGWLRQRYGSIAALNEAWGTVFWAQEYADFESIELPAGTVTEANPAHRLDYWRFSSDQVIAFNREQARQVRAEAGPEVWITHNFMGNFTDFDHHAVAADVDIASWDSYPLGFLDQGWFSEDEKQTYRRLGHPDWAAFHHDLYRGVGRGRMAVMEQQPGPVNWATSNAMPTPGAVALWSMEAIAHGAEFVSYFRFRQNPRAQEQMHAALQLPDGSPAPAHAEIASLAQQLHSLPAADCRRAPVALVFDYPSCWATAIQPHAPAMRALEVSFEYYRALRELGLDIDIVGPASDLSAYALVVLPAQVFLSQSLVADIRQSGAACVAGPGCGSRTESGAIPDELPPGPLQQLLPLRVTAVDSMRPGSTRGFTFRDQPFAIERWYESVDTALDPQLRGESDTCFWYRSGDYHYLNGWVDYRFLKHVLGSVLAERGVPMHTLDAGLRLRTRGTLEFVFNYGPQTQRMDVPEARCLLGDEQVAPGNYAVWQRDEGL